jgi:hypothetical protein
MKLLTLTLIFGKTTRKGGLNEDSNMKNRKITKPTKYSRASEIIENHGSEQGKHPQQ